MRFCFCLVFDLLFFLVKLLTFIYLLPRKPIMVGWVGLGWLVGWLVGHFWLGEKFMSCLSFSFETSTICTCNLGNR